MAVSLDGKVACGIIMSEHSLIQLVACIRVSELDIFAE